MSVELPNDQPLFAINTGDSGYPDLFPPNITVDEKPMDELFNFDHFPIREHSANLVDSSDSLCADFSESQFSNPYGLVDAPYDANSFDLQNPMRAFDGDGDLAA